MRQVLETPMGRLSVTDDLMVAQAQERIMLIAKGEAPLLEDEAAAETALEPARFSLPDR